MHWMMLYDTSLCFFYILVLEIPLFQKLLFYSIQIKSILWERNISWFGSHSSCKLGILESNARCCQVDFGVRRQMIQYFWRKRNTELRIWQWWNVKPMEDNSEHL